MTEPVALGGRYELGEVLGRGGMAEVRAGLDTRLGRAVAVKMLRPDLARDPSFQARFRREAQSAASLNHPSIVAVYDTGEEQVDGASVPYIVMEYVEGTTLRELLSSGRRLLPERALEIAGGILEALDYSHRNGIVHRDIKPANVMLTGNGSVKVMDFGIARAVADTSATMTQTSAVIGTAQYLSPEQARGESVDVRTDLYSTGCVLYELLTGRPPFVGDSPVSVVYQHVGEDPVPPSVLDPEISPAIDAIVLKSLAKNRDNRYQTAAEMRGDIERALAGRPVQAPPVLAEATRQMTAVSAGAPAPRDFAPQRPARADRSRGWVWALLGVLAVLLLAGLVFALTRLAGNNTAKAPTMVTVPDVVNKNIDDAVQQLANDNLKADRQPQERTDKPANTVVAQSPPPRAQVTPGSTVTLTYAVQPSTVQVPNSIVGMPEADAIKLLTQVNLRFGGDKPQDSPSPASTVLDSDPPPGTPVARDTPVTLVVASGKNKVPSVVGRSQDDATRTLNDAGFSNVTVTEVPTDTQASDGKVQNQSAPADSVQSLATQITITVARYQPPVQPTTPPPATTTPPTPSRTFTISPPPEGWRPRTVRPLRPSNPVS